VQCPAKLFSLKQNPTKRSVKVAMLCTHSHKKERGNYRTTQALTGTRELPSDNLSQILD